MLLKKYKYFKSLINELLHRISCYYVIHIKVKEIQTTKKLKYLLIQTNEDNIIKCEKEKKFCGCKKRNEQNFCCHLASFLYLLCWRMIKMQFQVTPTQLELHSPVQINENSNEIEKDWVKDAEEQIELLQRRTSVVLQSLNFIFWNLFIYWNKYFAEFAGNY